MTRCDGFSLNVQSKVKGKVSHLCPILCNPMDYTVHGILQARILEWVAFPFSRGSFQPRDPTQVSCIAGRSLPAESQGKPKNTGVGSLSLLQWIFQTQESNQGLALQAILYQLSYEGSYGGKGEQVFNGDKTSVWEDKKVLETDGGDDCKQYECA